MPEEQRSPDLEVTPPLRQQNESAISAMWLEAPIDDLGDIAEPGVAARSDKILFTKPGQVLALRARKVPRREHGIGFGDQRTLDQGE